jgi:hypothetical protein
MSTENPKKKYVVVGADLDEPILRGLTIYVDGHSSDFSATRRGQVFEERTLRGLAWAILHDDMRASKDRTWQKCIILAWSGNQANINRGYRFSTGPSDRDTDDRQVAFVMSWQIGQVSDLHLMMQVDGPGPIGRAILIDDELPISLDRPEQDADNDTWMPPGVIPWTQAREDAMTKIAEEAKRLETKVLALLSQPAEVIANRLDRTAPFSIQALLSLD